MPRISRENLAVTGPLQVHVLYLRYKYVLVQVSGPLSSSLGTGLPGALSRAGSLRGATGVCRYDTWVQAHVQCSLRERARVRVHLEV